MIFKLDASRIYFFFFVQIKHIGIFIITHVFQCRRIDFQNQVLVFFPIAVLHQIFYRQYQFYRIPLRRIHLSI